MGAVGEAVRIAPDAGEGFVVHVGWKLGEIAPVDGADDDGLGARQTAFDASKRMEAVPNRSEGQAPI